MEALNCLEVWKWEWMMSSDPSRVQNITWLPVPSVPLLWGGFWVRSRRMLIWCTAPKGSNSSLSSVSDQERGICPTNILMESGSGWSRCSSDPFILPPLLEDKQTRRVSVCESQNRQLCLHKLKRGSAKTHQLCNKVSSPPWHQKQELGCEAFAWCFITLEVGKKKIYFSAQSFENTDHVIDKQQKVTTTRRNTLSGRDICCTAAILDNGGCDKWLRGVWKEPKHQR